MDTPQHFQKQYWKTNLGTTLIFCKALYSIAVNRSNAFRLQLHSKEITQKISVWDHEVTCHNLLYYMFFLLLTAVI